jgi:hypothetical protein
VRGDFTGNQVPNHNAFGLALDHH